MHETTAERRAVERVRDESVGPVSYRTDAAEASSLASIADFTTNGIGLVVHRPIAVGASLTIEAGPHGKRLPTHLTAKVRHVESLADGRYFLGCRFTGGLSDEDVLALG